MGCCSHSPSRILIVRQVSANISSILGLLLESVLDRSFETALGAQLFEAFQTRLLSDVGPSAAAFHLPVKGNAVEVECIAHRKTAFSSWNSSRLMEGIPSVYWNSTLTSGFLFRG
jgi:light-regulated signal transduction histidine kinase (bacteriophytochrome)